MVAPEVQSIDLFKIAGRSISGWVPSLKTGTVVRQPFCSQLEERLLLWLEYHPQVASYARGDIGPDAVEDHAALLVGVETIVQERAQEAPALRNAEPDGSTRIVDRIKELIHQDRYGTVRFSPSQPARSVLATDQSALAVARVSVAVVGSLSKNTHMAADPT